ncbi:hypothetical protein GGTG_05228 [Gaeumannomyces tritici R3-111a-1]|uniref:Uncharacterized protein n=1 Tax=Gaeumannomyces tritici (strain R3-111a-1) TaxID=644352 RepID=J3NVB5_GAET3|nr:hypothetical protein GGTG_05228 [Gaeumannomyces tritici R3-111a-1]EJT75291.1 hypothetical protein GGTG_05228 [Gaeumannomyces tritici R3-111a-1]
MGRDRSTNTCSVCGPRLVRTVQSGTLSVRLSWWAMTAPPAYKLSLLALDRRAPPWTKLGKDHTKSKQGLGLEEEKSHHATTAHPSSEMCEIHYYRCTTCSVRWEAHKKLASCESSEPEERCPKSLIMIVGNQRRPQKRECDSCQHLREVIESMQEDDNSEDERARRREREQQRGRRGGGM